jgi:hypothetical protein
MFGLVERFDQTVRFNAKISIFLSLTQKIEFRVNRFGKQYHFGIWDPSNKGKILIHTAILLFPAQAKLRQPTYLPTYRISHLERAENSRIRYKSCAGEQTKNVLGVFLGRPRLKKSFVDNFWFGLISK